MRRLTPPCVAVAGLGLLVACGGGDVLLVNHGRQPGESHKSVVWYP